MRCEVRQGCRAGGKSGAPRSDAVCKGEERCERVSVTDEDQ